jgi:hypothetical protein
MHSMSFPPTDPQTLAGWQIGVIAAEAGVVLVLVTGGMVFWRIVRGKDEQGDGSNSAEGADA